MSEKPIQFSGSMVRAILDNRKSQTRRCHGKPHFAVGDRLWVRETWNIVPVFEVDNGVFEAGCPFATIPKTAPSCGYAVSYAANNDEEGPWRPSIHMPKWAARIWLEVTSVRAERLRAISEDDAVAEGCVARPSKCEPCAVGLCSAHQPPIGQFIGLWDSINGKSQGDPGPTIHGCGYTTFGLWRSAMWMWVYDFGLWRAAMNDEVVRKIDKYSRVVGYDTGTPEPPKVKRCNNCAHRQSEHGGDGQGHICRLLRKCVSLTHTCDQWKLWQLRSRDKA